jgi:hypothetical protein
VPYDWRLRERGYGQRNEMPQPSGALAGASTWTGHIRAEKAGGRQ